MYLTNWIDTLNFSGGILALVLAVSQLLLKKKNQRNYILIAAFMSISLLIFSGNFHIFKGMDNWYELSTFVFLFYTIPYHCTIVLIFIFLYTLGQKELGFQKKHLLLFIPGLIDLAVVITFGRSPVNYRMGIQSFGYFMKLRFTVFTITMFILSYRYPHVLNISRLGGDQNYSFNTNTINLDVERIINELNALSNDRAVLSDPSLTLKKTADMLEIRPHQLSEILNLHVKKTFPAWIKEERIKRAEEMLLSSPEKKILEIARNAGFNSISVFNEAFKNQFGLSPSAYRKKIIN